MRSFSEMEGRFGAGAAYHCLLEIEKAARIPWTETCGVDNETRFRNACCKQDMIADAEQRAVASRVA